MENTLIINDPSDVYGLSNLIYKDESYNIISCCLEVHKTLGKGFLETIYKDALMHEFKLKNIPFNREQKFEVPYKDIILPHYYCSDFIVYDKIVLEIKAQQDVIDQHYKQVINYLAVSKLKLGLLVNFGEPSLKFKRVVL
ncbi:MAG: GxxExxY protein [Bacteroidia bacterium]